MATSPLRYWAVPQPQFTDVELLLDNKDFIRNINEEKDPSSENEIKPINIEANGGHRPCEKLLWLPVAHVVLEPLPANCWQQMDTTSPLIVAMI